MLTKKRKKKKGHLTEKGGYTTSATCGFALVNVSGRLLASCIWDLKLPNLF